MSPSLVDADVNRLATAIAPSPDDVLADMHDRAERESFPHVGPAVGGWLALLARAVDARRVFEFGSGFGYSAYWIARELPAGGEVVLTEVDADELDLARDYFERGGLADRARFEHGDALETVEAVEGAVDLVLIDHQKERYVEAFEAIRDHVPAGGIVTADNAVTAGHIEPADVRALVEGRDRPDASEASRGIAAYLCRVRDDSAFTSGLLPLGEGLSVSVRR
jgi:predicted O-methyltransferase YrrM